METRRTARRTPRLAARRWYESAGQDRTPRLGPTAASRRPAAAAPGQPAAAPRHAAQRAPWPADAPWRARRFAARSSRSSHPTSPSAGPASSDQRPGRRNNDRRQDRSGCGPLTQTDAAARQAGSCLAPAGQIEELNAATGTCPANGDGTSRRSAMSSMSLSAGTSASGTWRRSARSEGYSERLSSVAIIGFGLFWSVSLSADIGIGEFGLL
jgi:hypothetical protein